MGLFISIQWGLWVLSVVAEILVAIRLIREGLIRRYPFFIAFLTAETICSLVAMQTGVKSRHYAEMFRVCTLILIFFRLGVAAELYERICEHFPGIGRFRIGLAAALVLIAAPLAIFSFQPNLVTQWAFPQTGVEVLHRYLSEILAASLILSWIFLRFILSIRQAFRPNVMTHWTIATLYFGASGAAYLLIQLNGGGMTVYPVNCALLAIHLSCFFAWFRLLRRSGEELPDYGRLSPHQIQTVEQYNRDLLQTVMSLPGEISARRAEN